MKNKKDNNFVSIYYVIFFFAICISFIYFCNECNIELTTIINIVIAMLIITLFIYIPYKIADNKYELVNGIFILDITSKLNNNEHIRITEKNLLFKYKNVIKHYFIFPRYFSTILLKGKLCETPTHSINGKRQLSNDETNDILEKINALNNNVDGDIIVNYRGNKKFVNKNDVDKIFKEYKIKI